MAKKNPKPKIKQAQYRDDAGKWFQIPITDFRLGYEAIAFEYSKSSGLDTRVVEIDEDGNATVLKKFHKQRR